MSDPDQRLMRRFQKGDVPAFEVLLHKFQGPVLSLVRRYLGSKSPGIDDVAQEVFIRVFRSKHTYEPRAKVGTWIYRITVNTCLNEIRRLGADKNRRVGGFTAVFGGAGEDDDASIPLADEASRPPSEGVETSELEAHVRVAIDTLPPQQRLAVVLSRYHGLPYEEVAAAMDSTVPAVKSLLTRARESLRAALEAYVSGDATGTESETHEGDDEGAATPRARGAAASPSEKGGDDDDR